MCANPQAHHAIRPRSLIQPKSITAARLPIVARSPACLYANGTIRRSSASRARITVAACRPPCLAASPTPGTGLPFGPEHRRRVADDEDVGMSRHGQVGIDLDPPGLVRRHAEPLRHRRRLHARRPDHRPRPDPPVAEQHGLVGHRGHRPAELDLHAELLQRLERVVRRDQARSWRSTRSPASIRITRASSGSMRAELRLAAYRAPAR